MIALGGRVEVVRGAHIVCAVSGGVDSVALLLLLVAARDEGILRLSAAHFEHGIRGESSAEDARFVKILCEKLNVPCHIGSADIPAMAKGAGTGLEETARNERYRFLRRIKDRENAAYIATAHHADDQAETVLMHLLRGSGLSGVCGMRLLESDLYRPLLDYGKDELIAYVRGRGETWREDATNALADTPRNALRLRVLPELKAIYPGCVGAIGRFARVAQEENQVLDAQARAFLAKSHRVMPFGWALDVNMPPDPVLLRRALHALLPECDQDALRRAAGLIDGEAKAIALSGGNRFERGAKRLYYIRNGAARSDTILPLADGVSLPGIGGVRLRPATGEAVTVDPYRQIVSARALAGACVRTRRPGDRIVPFGLNGTKDLSDYLIDRKVDRPLRDSLLLIANEHKVLWVAGVGLSETLRARENEPTMEILFTGDKLLP